MTNRDLLRRFPAQNSLFCLAFADPTHTYRDNGGHPKTGGCGYPWETGVTHGKEQNPFDQLRPPATETPRDRILDDREIRELMAALEAEPYPLGPVTKLLLLTGARRSEIGEIYTIGPFPLIDLKTARKKATKAKALLADGIDPSAHKREAKAAAKAKAFSVISTLFAMTFASRSRW